MNLKARMAKYRFVMRAGAFLRHIDNCVQCRNAEVVNGEVTLCRAGNAAHERYLDAMETVHTYL
jgi:hypothetical protein